MQNAVTIDIPVAKKQRIDERIAHSIFDIKVSFTQPDIPKTLSQPGSVPTLLLCPPP